MQIIATTTKIMSMRVVTTKQIDIRCKDCFRRVYSRLLKKYDVSTEASENFMGELESFVNTSTLSSPEIQRELHARLSKLLAVSDFFAEEKHLSNLMGMQLYHQWKPRVMADNYPFRTALRLSIAGNIMDYGASDTFNVEASIQRILDAPFAIDHAHLLETRIQNAKTVLYLGDNAGEIAFDKLFIETMGNKNLYFAVKSAPILNDVTKIDADFVGMNDVANVISNGYDAPSTVLQHCSTEFLNIFASADVIISKGQGNLEGLMGRHDGRIFFMLIVKCDAIAELLQVHKGDIVVVNGADI